MRQHFPIDPATGLESQALLPWFDGDPVAGIEGSFPGQRLCTDAEAEILTAQRAGGLTDSPDGSDTGQLAQMIGRGIWMGPYGASPNALAGQIGSGVTGGLYLKSLPSWMRLRGVALQTNTSSTVTYTAAGVGSAAGVLTGPLLRNDGQPLAIGDVPANRPFEVMFDGSGNFLMVGAVASQTAQAIAATTRVVLRANLNIYVNGATGSDNNNGLTPATAFATLQGAVNAVAPAYDTAGYAITINVAAGLYAPVYIDQAAALKLNFLGNTGNLAQVTVNSPNATTPCFAVKRGSRINVQGFTLTGVGNGLDANNLGQIEYGYIAFNNQGYNLSAYYVSQLTQIAPVSIGANCQGHVNAGIQSSINIAFGSVSFPQSGTVTFSVGFAVANDGTILANGLTLAYTGNSAGPRYQATFGGHIYVAGGGANALPGSTAGSASASSSYE